MKKLFALLLALAMVLSMVACGGNDAPAADAPAAAAPAADAPAQQAVSAADEILKFKQLLDAGVITQEEFNAKKAQLLGL